MADHSVIDHLESVWSSIIELCEDLPGHAWDLPTDCPGWTVKDQLAHLVGTETSLTGGETPEPSERAHVRNELGAFNEAWVDSFRDLPGPSLLSRFVAITGQRLEALRGMPGGQWEAETETPLGTMAYQEFMQIRQMDSWVHEQDIRGAVNRPGGLKGEAAEAAIDKLMQSLGFVVGKKVKPPEGTVITVRLHGDIERTRSIEVSGGRGRTVEAPGEPAAVISTDGATFGRLAAGRWTADRVLEAGLVGFEGDPELGRSVVGNLATTP